MGLINLAGYLEGVRHLLEDWDERPKEIPVGPSKYGDPSKYRNTWLSAACTKFGNGVRADLYGNDSKQQAQEIYRQLQQLTVEKGRTQRPTTPEDIALVKSALEFALEKLAA